MRIVNVREDEGMPKGVAKRDLPSKTCVVCGRPMVWRKAWAKNWDEVKYCSDACRKRRGSAAGAT